MRLAGDPLNLQRPPVRPVTRAVVGWEVRRYEPLASSVRDLYRPSCKELRGVEDRGRQMRNARSVAVDGRSGGHDPPRFARGFPGRYGHRLLPVCCPTADSVLNHNLSVRPHHSSCVSCKDGGLRFSIPLATADACTRPLPHGPIVDRGQRFSEILARTHLQEPQGADPGVGEVDLESKFGARDCVVTDSEAVVAQVSS
jgi:hypothetical protein